MDPVPDHSEDIRQGNHRLDGLTALITGADALEMRHASFATPECYELLRDRNVALVEADSAGRWPSLSQLTGDFVYVHPHGDDELYVSGYRDDQPDRWTQRIRGWLSGTD